METTVYQRLARRMFEVSDLKFDLAAARRCFPPHSIPHFFCFSSFTFDLPFFHCFIFISTLCCVALFPALCLPSLCFPSICLPHWAFPLKTKETRNQGIAQTAAQTPAVTACNKPLFSIPLCTLSHFPISPHSLAWHFVLIFHSNKREAYQYFWLRNEINRQHPSKSCWNFPFFFLS